MSQGDLAGKAYWDTVWTEGKIPEPVNPRGRGARNHYNRQLDTWFHKILTPAKDRPVTLLEIGCARSSWLPYFAREFGYAITGLDYSELGCEQERAILKKANIPGEIVYGDMFAPPQAMQSKFDVVISFGVAEHFEQTETCIAAFASFVKPGGIVVTLIPNMVGMNGSLTKWVNRPVYDIHVPLDAQMLQQAHTKAGLEVESCSHLMSTNFGVPNLNGLDPTQMTTRMKRILLRGLHLFSHLIYWIEEKTTPLPATRLLSPYIVCVARKRAAAERTP